MTDQEKQEMRVLVSELRAKLVVLHAAMIHPDTFVSGSKIPQMLVEESLELLDPWLSKPELWG